MSMNRLHALGVSLSALLLMLFVPSAGEAQNCVWGCHDFGYCAIGYGGWDGCAPGCDFRDYEDCGGDTDTALNIHEGYAVSGSWVALDAFVEHDCRGVTKRVHYSPEGTARRREAATSMVLTVPEDKTVASRSP